MTGNYLPNNTFQRFSIWVTDVEVMWDNGIADDPDTPITEHQVLIAVETRSAGRP
jgi:D-arabinan endo alpha-(1,5)-arabinofuranosidase